eukprot:TRINITY_DN15342_c0_g1_i1.p1 TRINITY_DN15342_c0_g1~~TRINITY_DN15342_c0_g1_i1.p1  ORF type:complete len:328 (+),score=133.91 TRINITY_DN15342_c0_g1_i1:71-1054(+)
MGIMRGLFILLVVSAATTSAGKLRGLNGECAEFCSRVSITLIEIDALGGSFSTLSKITPEMSSADAKQLRPYLTADASTNSTLIVIDNLSTYQATLYVYSDIAANVTHTVTFSDTYQKQAFTSLFFDAAGNRLLATFGNQLVSIDRQTASITPLLTMYDNTKFQVGPASISLLDPLSGRYYTSALESTDMTCFYLFGANLTDQSIVQSACIPNPVTTPGALIPTQMQPYNGTALASVWLNQQTGMDIELMDPISLADTIVLSNDQLNRLGWFMGNYSPLAFDQADNVYWLYIFDGKDYRFVKLQANGQYTTGGAVKLPNVVATVFIA